MHFTSFSDRFSMAGERNSRKLCTGKALPPPLASSSHTCLLHPPLAWVLSSPRSSISQLFKYVMQTHGERERVWMVSRETGEGGSQIPDFKTTLESLAVSLSSMCGQQSLPPPTGHVEVSPCSSNKFQHPPQC